MFCSFDFGCFSPLSYKTAGADLPMRNLRDFSDVMCAPGHHMTCEYPHSVWAKKTATCFRIKIEHQRRQIIFWPLQSPVTHRSSHMPLAKIGCINQPVNFAVQRVVSQ